MINFLESSKEREEVIEMASTDQMASDYVIENFVFYFKIPYTTMQITVELSELK